MPHDIRHSSESQLWLTPPDICSRVHKVFDGPPDLDPASSPKANIFMQAKRIMTEKDDSLVTPWWEKGQAPRSVWLNPPGGVDDKRKSMTGRFWARLMHHYDDDDFGHAMFMCFNLNVLQVTQNLKPRVTPVTQFPIVILRSRLRFWLYDENDALSEGTRPSHPNAIVYVPGRIDRTLPFVDTFHDLGDVVCPYV